MPLSGIRVLDLSQVMAGPFCCMLLGDMGADVIKVEPPGVGDQTRKSMGFRMKGEDSPGFLALNRNKRSITIDLKNEAGRKVFYELAKTADVVVENSRPGVAKKLGIDYPTLVEDQPAAGLCLDLGLWPDRPVVAAARLRSHRPGDERDHQRHGPSRRGAGEVRRAGRRPRRRACSRMYGILSAVIGRDKTGLGQYIDTSLFDAALALSVWETTEFWATGTSPRPLGTANRMSAPYQAFSGSDGRFVVGAANQRLWIRFLDVIGRPEMAEDPRYIDNKDRVAYRDVLAQRARRRRS